MVHHPRHIRHIVGPVHARPRVIAVDAPEATPNLAESSRQMRTMPVYVMRPVSCDSQPPVALQSLEPAAFKPPAQKLLDELVGPPAQVAEAPVTSLPGDVIGDLTPGVPPIGGFGGFGGGGPGVVGPIVGGPGGGGPGGGQPPVTPPVVTPPVGPPEGPPVVVPPVVVPPVVVPPVIVPPVITPPEGPPPVIVAPPPPPPVTSIPEPATWAMMILGFAVVGGALRARSAAARRAQ